MIGPGATKTTRRMPTVIHRLMHGMFCTKSSVGCLVHCRDYDFDSSVTLAA